MKGVFLIDNGLGFVAVLAIILLFTKLFGLLFRKIGLPQVLGYIIAGIVIGPAIFGELCGFSLIGLDKGGDATYHCLFLLSGTEDGESFSLGTNGLQIFSKIGVLLLMFSTGLETDLKELKKTGLAATLIACAGVAVPLVLGLVISLPFGGIGLGTAHIYRCIFIGAILTATSVAITVSVLKELGKISTKLGTTIVSAAIIDDVIGIVVLSVVTGIAKSGAADASIGGFAGFKATIYGTIIMIIAFFIVAIGLGFGISKLFRWMESKWPNTRRLSIFSLVVCFLYAWAAEEIFGVADITGAFLAGLIISTAHGTREYADKKVEVNTYMLFAPVFFANIGISNITFLGLSPMLLLFAVLAVLMGLIGKIVGCGAVAKGFKYNMRESAIAGVGMMARGEVALIVTATAMNPALGENALPAQFMLMTVLLILVSSILTPILLKWLYGKEPKTPEDGLPEETAPNGEPAGTEQTASDETAGEASAQAPATEQAQ